MPGFYLRWAIPAPLTGMLEKTGWVIMGAHGAARVLGLHEGTLRSRMKKLGIVRPQA